MNLIYKVGLEFTLATPFKLIVPMAQKSFSSEVNILLITFYTTRDKVIRWHF